MLKRLLLVSVMLLLASCNGNQAAPMPTTALTAQLTVVPTMKATLVPTTAPTALPKTTPIAVPNAGAFESGKYRNLFKEMLGKSDAEIQAKIDKAWQQLFYGDDDSQRVYYPVGDDMAYVMDIGNGDVRSEGMSYGMMLAVQLDKQEEFNRLWKWAKTYMYHEDIPYKGYFSWHNKPNGEQLDANPASDGEEWFAMALMFASNRWQHATTPDVNPTREAWSRVGSDGKDIFNYSAEAQNILDTTLHTEDGASSLATNMFNAKNHQVVFVPKLGRDSTFTDPSYHLPAYYELWARWAKRDNEFWKQAAQASRAFWKTSSHPQTGLNPDYANFDGTPTGGEHQDFRFDAFRVASNIAVDYAWFAADDWEIEQSNRLLDFFYKQGIDEYVNQYTLDGKPLSSDRSSGLIAMNAVAALASNNEHAPEFVQALWDTEIPTGKWRYYDGLLYFLALLHASGRFQIHAPN